MTSLKYCKLMTKEHRDRWPSRHLFLFAAIGAAVGLGNVWRFPYLAGQFGGGAFLIPYLIALFVIGLPLIIMEFALGQKMQQGIVGSMRQIDRRLAGVGLGSVLTSFGVSAYYAVILGWCILYTLYSFTLQWGHDPQGFFFENVLQLSGSAETIQGIATQVLVGAVLSWILVYFSIWKGVKSISSVIKITMPLPIILLVILFFRVITLEGAIDGILFFLTPNWNALFDTQVWAAAIGQIFFTLALGFGAMVTYASYEYKTNDVIKAAFIATLSDGAIGLIAGFTVFATVGYLTHDNFQSIQELASLGPSLAFVIFPKALSAMPGAIFVAILFFVMLVTLSINSLFSLVEVVSALFEDLLYTTKKEVIVFAVCLVSFLFGLVFCTTAGIYYIDITDHFITHYSLVLMGLFQSLAVGWVLGAENLRHFINETSHFKIGKTWDVLIKYIIPTALVFVLGHSLYTDLTHTYGDYPEWAVFAFGWALVLLMLLAAISFSVVHARKKS